MLAEPQAMGDRPARLKPGEDGFHITMCRICEAVCGMVAEVRGGKIVKVTPDRDNPHSKGHICVKGPGMVGITYDPDRLTRPMKRVGGPGEFAPVSWDEAMDDIANRLAEILKHDGADAVATYFGNPASFNTQVRMSLFPFMARHEIWKSYSAASLDTAARYVANYILWGISSQTAIPDLARSHFLLMLGANPMVSHASLITAPRVRDDMDAIAARGRVVVVDPRRTETAVNYEHVPIRPDTDVWLLAAMINTLFEEGLAHIDVLEKETWGWEQLRDAVKPVTAELAERYCGVPAGQIRQLARDFEAAPSAAAYGRLGLCRGSFSTMSNVMIEGLGLVTGHFGKPGGTVLGDSPMASTTVGFYGADYKLRETRLGPVPSIVGFLPFSHMIEEMTVPGEGRVRALITQSGNPVLAGPGAERLEAALADLELFVSFDLYQTETNRYADYILPCTTFYEREDLPTIPFSRSVRPYAQYTDAVIKPVGECKTESEIFTDLDRRMHPLLSRANEPPPEPYDPVGMVDAMLRAGPMAEDIGDGSGGISAERLKANPHGLQLAENLSCGPWGHKIFHEDGRIHLWHPILEEEFARLHAAKPAAENEIRLFSQRNIRTMNSWMHNVERLSRGVHPVLSINPDDAALRGVQNGDQVRVASAHGEITVPAHVTTDVMAGSVCYPHGWGHYGTWQRANAKPSANVNVLAGMWDGEQVSGSILLDGIVVTVERAQVAAE